MSDVQLEWGAIGPSGRVWVPNPTDGSGQPVEDLEAFVREFALGSGMTLVARRSGEAWEAACMCAHARDQHDEQGHCDHCDDLHCPGFLPAARLDDGAHP